MNYFGCRRTERRKDWNSNVDLHNNFICIFQKIYHSTDQYRLPVMKICNGCFCMVTSVADSWIPRSIFNLCNIDMLDSTNYVDSPMAMSPWNEEPSVAFSWLNNNAGQIYHQNISIGFPSPPVIASFVLTTCQYFVGLLPVFFIRWTIHYLKE